MHPAEAAGAPRGAAVPSGPTALRIMVGSQLRRLREAKGISRERAAESIRATHSKISRLELGRSSFKQRDLSDLLNLYGILDPDERSTLFELARQAARPGWWHHYQDIMPGWLEPYIGLETAASVIRTYEVQFVHGLMQTEDYARAVVRMGNAVAPPAEIDRRVALRMTRQSVLDGPNPPKVWSVLDEAALRRPLGGRDVMRRQLSHLLDLTDHHGVTLQILPFHAGAHPAAGGPFTILRFPHGDLPDVIYLEQLNSALYLDKADEVHGYMRIMDELCVVAESKGATRQTLADLLDRI
ncbi:helix-turn-helix transcriptional regulator [Actinocorallia longicatena]|uniref:Helix-turn-helix transcriptional regulator n=1 Tax=Actinocorallia longicatena TaxID=111803 RepID=A0ABP6Q9A4_9ACTN